MYMIKPDTEYSDGIAYLGPLWYSIQSEYIDNVGMHDILKRGPWVTSRYVCRSRLCIKVSTS